jgi:hypothetical protein
MPLRKGVYTRLRDGCHLGLVQHSDRCHNARRLLRCCDTSLHPPITFRVARTASRARPPFPRAAAIYDRVARHSKRRFYPRAKKSRSNFPRFEFSKRGFCAPHPSENTPQTDLGFRTSFARVFRVFCDSHPRARAFDTDFRPPIRVENQNRRFPQCTCTWRATNRRRLKRSHQNHPAVWHACPAKPGQACHTQNTQRRSLNVNISPSDFAVGASVGGLGVIPCGGSLVPVLC